MEEWLIYTTDRNRPEITAYGREWAFNDEFPYLRLLDEQGRTTFVIGRKGFFAARRLTASGKGK